MRLARRSEKMAVKNIGKITQVIGAVLDVKYTAGNLPESMKPSKLPEKMAVS